PKCKGEGKRETNTMPQWAGSSWYYLRYIDPKNRKKIADIKKMKYWLPVDLYFGGMEHTTLHLLYSRFWHLFLYDKKLVPVPEPYTKRVPHGIILGPDGEKMSKSRGNIVNPDNIIKEYGADTLRMYEMFLGPHEATVAWKTEGIVGIKRFLDRIWKLSQRSGHSDTFVDSDRLLHKTIKKVTEDIENFRFNTAISALMIFLNKIERLDVKNLKLEIRNFLLLLAPFAPHMTEEIWRNILKNKKSIHLEAWPKYDPKLIEDDIFELIVQINGKVRDRFEARVGISQNEAEDLTFSREKVKNILGPQKPKKVIFVPNRLINLVL
ncbi:MAG: class I tRNA ligase family protein, partial [Patescibacteria group bacterium]